MTNAEKYLKENVDIHTLSKEIISFMNGVVEDKYIGMIEDFFNCPVKPILSEEEKVILKSIDKKLYQKIGRARKGVYVSNDDTRYYIKPFELAFKSIKLRRRI